MKKIFLIIGGIVLASIISTTLTMLIGGFTSSLPNSESLIGIMLAMLAIIIALSAAYSFYSIYNADTEMRNLKLDFEKLSTDVEQAITDLNNVRNRYDTLRVLEDFSTAATDAFNNKHYFRALKAEIDYVALILRNYQYCTDIFESKTGEKRANIANDMLHIYGKGIRTHLEVLGEGEFRLIRDVIIRLSEDIVQSSNFYRLHAYEQKRYRFLFEELENLMNAADKNDCEYKNVTSEDNIKKLIIYSNLWDNKKKDEEHLVNMSKRVDEEFEKYNYIFAPTPQLTAQYS
jgi:hypothetical protein|nr:MAG TPA: SMODS and SLOG-associating 2TM effector domain family 4 [Caudoviricetes sp.]